MLKVVIGYFMKRVTNQVNVNIGVEMRAAYQVALKLSCKVVLGDRPIDTTIQRCWTSMNIFQKVKLVAHFLYAMTQSFSKEEIEMLKEKNVLTEMLEEFSKQFPQLSKVLIDGKFGMDKFDN